MTTTQNEGIWFLGLASLMFVGMFIGPLTSIILTGVAVIGFGVMVYRHWHQS
jgi:hypothetical protein